MTRSVENLQRILPNRWRATVPVSKNGDAQSRTRGHDEGGEQRRTLSHAVLRHDEDDEKDEG